MNTLLDNIFALVMGMGLLTFVLGASWLKSGQRGLLMGAILAACLALGLVVLDQVIVTERERIERTIQQIAVDVERGDVRALLAHIHPDAVETRTQAATEFPLYRIKSVRIKHGMQIAINSSHDPPEAKVEFNVVVEGSDAAGIVSERQVPRFVELRMWKDGDLWKIRDYRHADPLEGMRKHE